MLTRALRWLTLDQYDWIDREHKTLKVSDRRLLVVLATIAISFVVARYFGRASHVSRWSTLHQWLLTSPFPELSERLYWAGFKFINYLLIPLVAIKLCYRDSLKDYGFRGGGDRRIWLLYLAMFLVVLPLVWLVSHDPSFLKKYPKYALAGRSWQDFLVWEAAYATQFVLLEAFFRGLALFALAKHLGSAAIFVMVIPYAMIHFAKPMPETAGSIITGIALGTLALRTRSILGGALIHIAVGVSMDVFAMMRKGTFHL